MGAWVAQHATDALLEWWTGEPVDSPQARRAAIDNNLMELWYLLHLSLFVDRTYMLEPEDD